MKTKQVKKGTIQPIKSFQTLDEEAAFWEGVIAPFPRY